MSSQARVIEHLILSMLTQGPSSQRGNPANAAFVLAGILTLVGLGFLMAAGYDWMLINYDLQSARLYMGGLCIALALIAAASAGLVFAYKRKKAETYYMVVRQNIESAMAMIGNELEEPIRENPKTAVALAGLVGYIAAEKILH